MRTIAIVNQKGGCGKTTTAINLASIYAARGLPTLLVDMDPQSHCAAGLGVPEAVLKLTIGDALLADHDSRFDPSALLWEVGRNLHLAPSTMRLATLEAPGGGLHERPDKDRRLASLLARFQGRFARCLIDCPPTIGLLTFNALRAAREALIPVETGFFALRGAEKQWGTIQRMIERVGRPIACHILPSIHNPESKLARSILTSLRRQFAGQILPLEVRAHEVLREAASFGQPVMEYAPQSEAHQDFEQLADWLDEHATKAPTIRVEVSSCAARSAEYAAVAAAAAGDVSRPPLATPPLLPSRDVGQGSGQDRAAELVQRVIDLNRRASAPPAHPPVAVTSAPEPPGRPAPPPAGGHVPPIPGSRATSRGVHFVQPCQPTQSISVAGDFNQWSPSATPLIYNQASGVAEAFVPLAPGTYQYQVVVDGRWQLDAFAQARRDNGYGEANSVVVVTEQRGAP